MKTIERIVKAAAQRQPLDVEKNINKEISSRIFDRLEAKRKEIAASIFEKKS